MHSLADIEAKVWHTSREKVFFNQRTPTETGRTERKRRVNLGNMRINLNKPLSNFKNYDTINESRKLALFSNFYLPITFETRTNREYEYKDVTFTETEAIEMTVEKIIESLLKGIENEENIVNKQINTYGGVGYVEVEVIIEVLENIGIPRKM